MRRRVHVDLEEIRWKKKGVNNDPLSSSVKNITFNHNCSSQTTGLNSTSVADERNNNAIVSDVPLSTQNNSSHNQSSLFSNAQLNLKDVRLQVGSLRVESVCGTKSEKSNKLNANPLSSLSDTKNAIIPVSYEATR